MIYSGPKGNNVSWDYEIDTTNYSSININAYCYDSGSYTASGIKTTINKIEIYNK